jgi:hypothetical protein
MEPQSFPGTYRDADGSDDIEWTIAPSERPGWARRFEVRATILGVPVWGGDFDGLGPEDTDHRDERLALNQADEVGNCVLTGDLPCTFEVDGVRRPGSVRFELDLNPGPEHPPHDPKNLDLSCDIDGNAYAVTDDWFEAGLQRLETTFTPGTRLVACVTCLFSDYSPGGHGLTGMACHRDAKEQYLAVRSKADYWSVPVTEDVPETYLCPEYQRRVPGTGYRG